MATHSAAYNEIEENAMEREIDGFGVIIVSLIALMVESALFFWGISSPVSPALVLLLHGIVVAVLILWARATVKADRPAHMILLLVTLTAFMGPIGVAGTLITLLLSTLFETRPFGEWFADIFPEEEVPEGKQLVEYLRRYQDQVEEESQVLPFREVLMLGTTAQKQRMIGQITRNYHPSFAQGLKIALQDNSNAVRVQAATAINRIENAYTAQVYLLEKERDRDPKDIDTILALGNTYDNYAYSGVLDTEREQEYRSKALDCYRAYLKSEPDDEKVVLSVARIYYREGHYGELIRWAEQCIGRGLSSRSLILWLMEGYYYTHDYEGITRLADRFHDKILEEEYLPIEVKEALIAWSDDSFVADNDTDNDLDDESQAPQEGSHV